MCVSFAQLGDPLCSQAPSRPSTLTAAGFQENQVTVTQEPSDAPVLQGDPGDREAPRPVSPARGPG